MVGNGKPTTAINLAGPLVQTPANAFSCSKPTCAVLTAAYPGFAHAARPGLAETTLESAVSLADVVHPRPQPNLAILPAGRPSTASHDLLKPPRLGELRDEARQCYECIIVDTPPLVPVADCRLIEQRIDGFLVLVTVHMALRKLFEETLTVIDPAKLLGLIEDDRQIAGYYADYYSQSPNGSQNGRHSFRRRKIITYFKIRATHHRMSAIRQKAL
jgi:succinoglycan biosynthesis transport protein ExoP